MNVKNRKCIRKLSLKSLYANRRRNLIAIFAIALTTLLFTSMFTIVLSLNAYLPKLVGFIAGVQRQDNGEQGGK